jgi:hypothetical protein
VVGAYCVVAEDDVIVIFAIYSLNQKISTCSSNLIDIEIDIDTDTYIDMGTDMDMDIDTDRYRYRYRVGR